jgi:hypothetical protein
MNNNQANLSHGQNGTPLCGLDGTNPLGFLAALGAVRLLSIGNHCATISWQQSNGTWRPVLFGIEVPLGQLGKELHAAIGKLNKSIWSLDKKLPFAAERLRREALNSVRAASNVERGRADEIASLGVECFSDGDGDFDVTSLCMVRSGDASGQGLLAYGKRILESTTEEQLQQTVASDWVHEDDQCALRWDPGEDRGYALQWRNPSKVGALSIKGGNCLALLGMRLFSTIPSKRKGETVAFGLKLPKQSSFTWPIWKHPVSLDLVTSLLCMSDLQREQPPRSTFESRGIVAVYRCDRVMTSVYYANFTPARRVA